MSTERKRDQAPEDGKSGQTRTKAPPAGPHAKPELTNPDATPGAGTLPDPDERSTDGGAG
ncbi:hypothetical protein [Mangrovibrevibacter kandeliae]|uniref:hypothetical protein n=1 Tax=Mangrovibrevibacter kandeliae TaxID=2968473 RepID=UPI0021198E09|nr:MULTISPECIES: hypothetical protein [unclassified Aurantimonas]MCQ8783806.1 hypothetical protein [Aurantimonas sp. CSK15Z-1]MCW4116528.1 hypothetical protein [Aurantimonas sp. MSK8Z-1]